MHFPILSLLTILPTLSFALALPANLNPSDTTIAAAAPNTRFTISNFTSYIPSSSTPANRQLKSWASFLLSPTSSSTTTTTTGSAITCNLTTVAHGSLFSSLRYTPCESQDAAADSDSGTGKFWFRIPAGFGKVEIMSQWENDGTFFTGYADSKTNWMEGTGGNVTRYLYGKKYDRPAGWNFEMTKIVA